MNQKLEPSVNPVTDGVNERAVRFKNSDGKILVGMLDEKGIVTHASPALRKFVGLHRDVVVETARKEGLTFWEFRRVSDRLSLVETK